MPLGELQAARRRESAAASRRRWRSATRCARPSRSTRRCGVRARRGAGAAGRRTGQPARAAWRRWRSRRRISARAISELEALVAVDFNNVDAARQLADCCVRRASRTPRSCAPVYERIVAIDPFDAEAHAMLGRLALRAQRRRGGVARVPRRASRSARSTRPPRTPISARATSRAASAPRPRSRSLAALEIAPSYERAQDLLLKLVDKMRARRGRGAARRCSSLMPALQPRVDAQLAGGAAGRSLRRPAVALRPHQVPPQVRERPRPAGFLRRAVGHRRAGRRAEPVAPHQDRDRDPGRRSDRADARRSKRLFEYPWIYIVEPGNLRLQRHRGADPARVPAARRHADVRRLPRPDRVGRLRAAR